MLEVKKNVPYMTTEGGIFWTIRATPKDALKGDTTKNLFIVEVTDRNVQGNRSYATYLTTKSLSELREGLGLKKGEQLKITQ